jgi:hypothetical protein
MRVLSLLKLMLLPGWPLAGERFQQGSGGLQAALYFEPNVGQVSSEIRYVSRGRRVFNQ